MEEKDILEKLIDAKGLTFVVDTIIDICHEKAQHIRESYSDNSLAKVWEGAASQLANPKQHRPFPT